MRKKYYTFLKYFKYYLLFIISLFVRIFICTNKKILIFSSRGGIAFEGESKYLFNILNKEYKCYWISKDINLHNEIKRKGYESLYFFSIKSLIIGLKANAYFFTHSINDGLPILYNRKTKIINLWHGAPIKKIGIRDLNQSSLNKLLYKISAARVTNLICNSAFFIDHLNFGLGITKNKIIPCGSTVTFELKNRLSNLNEKVILYAPTFRDYEFENPIFKDKNLNKINDFLKKTNQNLKVKLHPIEYLKLNKSFSNIEFLDSSVDIYEVIQNCNHLITDYSSILFNYIGAFPERKISLYCPDLDIFKQKRGFNFNFEKVFEPYICYTVKDALNGRFPDKNIIKISNSNCDTIIEIKKIIN